MTRKHRIEHFLSSIVGTNVHSDSSDVLEKKKEMEKNLDKILKLIGDDTSTHQEYSLDSVDKSELSSLIKEFHSGYQALYHNYDHLIGKLKNKISPKERGNGDLKLKHSSSSSDSSDSDLDEAAPLMAKLEEKDALIRNLDNKLESVSGENEALKLENKMVKQDISNFEKEIEEKEFVISKLKKEVESVGGENEMLKLENKEARQDILKFRKEAEEKESVVSNLRKEIESVCGENAMLKLENKEARQEILKYKKEAMEKESVVSNLRKEIESVCGENEMLKLESKGARQQILKLEKEAEEKESVISNLRNSLETASDENEVLKVEKQEAFSQLSQVEKTLEVSEIKNDQLKKETLQLKEELGEKNLVISNLKKKLDMMETLENDNGALHERLRVICEENEKFVHISNFEMDRLRDEVSDLNQKMEEKSQLEADLNRQLNDANIEKEVLMSTNSGLLCELKEAKEDRESLKLVFERANTSIEELSGKLVSVEREHKNMQEEIERLCSKLQEEESIVSELTLKCEQLKDEKEKLCDANGDLNAKLERESTEKAELKQILEIKENENMLLANVVEKREVELQGLTDERDKLCDANGDLNAKLERESTEKAELQQILEIKENENILLANVVEKREVELQGLTDERDKLCDANGDLNAKLERESTEKAELKQILEIKENENMLLANVVEKREVELQGLTDERDKLCDANGDLNAKLERESTEKAELQQILEIKENENILLANVVEKREVELQGLTDERDKLCDANGDLNAKLERESTEKAELKQILEIKENENMLLANVVEKREVELQGLTDERDKLCDANGDLNAKLERESTEKAELQQILEIKENENILLANVVEKREVELQGLTDERDKLNAIRSELDRGIDDLRDKLKVLQEEKEGVEVKLRQVERGLEEARFENLELQGEIVNLSTEKLKVEEEVKLIFEKCLESQVLGKNGEERLRGKIVNQEASVDDIGYYFGELVSSCKELRDAYVDSMVHITALESLSTEQNREIKKLEETCLEQKGKLALSEGETAKLNVQLQALEVQLRLSNQKLKVTETECRYKEENSKKMVEGLNLKVQDLEGKMSKMIARLNYLENHLVETEQNAKVGISALGNRIKELKSIFDERFSSFVSRVLELNEELKFLKKNLDEEHSEKEKMKARLVELERRIKEEEIEINLKDEEKKEVIRQLCMAIEYYRENCNVLIAISKRTRR